LKALAATSGASTISFIVKPDCEDIETWCSNRMHDKYIESFVQQVTERLRHLVSSLAVLSKPRNDERSLAKTENDIHVAFADAQLPKNWLSRAEIDRKLKAWTEESKCAYVHIRGNEATGKTAIICQLHALLAKKRCYVITRFVNLTHESEYAHELWHGICMTLCLLSEQDRKPLLSSFHLSSTLSIFKSLLQKLDRPAFVLIDDANLIKYGRILSILDKPFRKCLSNLVLIATSNSSTTIPFMPNPILFE
uniref:NACHT domain-containing protein n=1 Tax=Gongylonema pulchrum TaxID=637853 RepID=A0A183DAC1_9BILA